MWSRCQPMRTYVRYVFSDWLRCWSHDLVQHTQNRPHTWNTKISWVWSFFISFNISNLAINTPKLDLPTALKQFDDMRFIILGQRYQINYIDYRYLRWQWIHFHICHQFKKYPQTLVHYFPPLQHIKAPGHPFYFSLTHWSWVTHICISKLTIIGSDNGLSPGWSQAIIWTNDGILLIGPLETNFSQIVFFFSNIFIQEKAFENFVCEMVSILSLPQCVNKQCLFPTQFDCSQSYLILSMSSLSIKPDTCNIKLNQATYWSTTPSSIPVSWFLP